ncbi:MAG TPA: co-chaperone GroES [Nitrospirae bacterium]|nr:co-chaperone GroES [Nitrospirota bacterium]
MITKKEIIIVGPRVLISPDETEGRTPSGLYLPPTVKEKEEVGGGLVIKTGPGYPVPDTTQGSEPWAESQRPLYIPLQAREGDYAIFLKKDAVEIEYEDKKYLIVPHSSILALIRTSIEED